MEELAHEKKVLAEHLDEWRKSRLGQFVLIRGDEVVGFFPELGKAFDEGTKRFGLAPFLVQQIAPPDSVNVSFLGIHLLATR